VSDVVPVTVKVGNVAVNCGAVRQGQWWTLNAARWPEIRVTGTDLVKVKATLAKRLEKVVGT
jgi:uncharacterized protein (DUF2237 family)